MSFSQAPHVYRQIVYYEYGRFLVFMSRYEDTLRTYCRLLVRTLPAGDPFRDNWLGLWDDLRRLRSQLEENVAWLRQWERDEWEYA